MSTRPSIYRSTLIAAAVAIGCFGAAAAQAHDHGWRGHDDDRGWHGHDRGWHEHDHYRGYFGPRLGYVQPVRREGWVDYAPPAVYYPAAPLASGLGGVSVVVRLPL
jgi:hypothetical protein